MTEVYATPVETRVGVADVGQQKRRDVRRIESGPIAQSIIPPVFGLIQRPGTQINTAMTSE